MKQSRSSKVIMTNEARVLRRLRLKNGLSMQAAGKALGCTDSYISHIENGRAGTPQGERLIEFLRVYGRTSEKYFRELVRGYDLNQTDLEVLTELIPKLKSLHLKTMRTLAENFLKDSR